MSPCFLSAQAAASYHDEAPETDSEDRVRLQSENLGKSWTFRFNKLSTVTVVPHDLNHKKKDTNSFSFLSSCLRSLSISRFVRRNARSLLRISTKTPTFGTLLRSNSIPILTWTFNFNHCTTGSYCSPYLLINNRCEYKNYLQEK